MPKPKLTFRGRDPKTGRYSASILTVLRLLAVATVVAVGGFILTTSMRRR